MKLNNAQNLTLAAACCVTLAFYIIVGSSASGGGPGFGSQSNPGMQGSQFGRAAASGTGTQPTASGPGFGPGNNPGDEGSAYGRSIASDASSGRSDASFFHSSNAEEVIDTDADSGKTKRKSAEDHADTTGTHVLTRISNETGVPVNTLQGQKSATGLGYGDLEAANLLAKASGQSFDNIVAKFKAGEGLGKIAHDMGLNLGKIVSDAHRSHLGQEKAPNTGNPSIISGPGIREDSILYTGISSIPHATVSKGVNAVPSATVSSRPSFTPGVSPVPSATVSKGVNPVPSATMSPRP
jgi:hypothetical protein